jgi:glycosyltransferase involved in cell wall biosynthesis
MQPPYPKVSIGLPVFNGEKYLAKLLNTMVAQDYEDFELIISDNASTDSTPQICREFGGRDRRIRYLRNEVNIGLAPNHNRVFKECRGEFFKWVAYDDEYSKDMIRRCVEVLQDAPPTVSVVYPACELIDESGKPLGVFSDRVALPDPRPHRRLRCLLSNLDIYNCTYGMMRSSILAKTRLYGSFPKSDHVLFAELAMLGELRHIPEPLLRLRHHPGRSFQANRTLQRLRELFDPVEAKKRSFFTLEGKVRWELLRSASLPSRKSDRLLCFFVAFAIPQYLRCKRLASHGRDMLVRTVSRK